MKPRIPVMASCTWLDLLVAGLVVGYLSMSRSFAHWGIGPVYVGEIALALILIGRPQSLIGGWLRSIVRPHTFTPLAWCMFISLAYGAVQATRGMFLGHNKLVTLQTVVFHVYPFFFFVGAWVGARRPAALRQTLRALAWVVGCYGMIYLLVLSPAGWTDALEGTEEGYVGLFGQPYGAAVALLGLLCFEPRWMRDGLPLVLNAAVLLAMQVRAAWLSFAIGVSLWAALSGRIGQLLAVFGILAALFGVALIADVEFPAASGRDDTVTARNLVGRFLAPLSPELAREFSDHVDFYTATVDWRTMWWKEIYGMVQETPTRAVIGPGYGYPIWELHPLRIGQDTLRTPHNVFVFALGYTGWLGVAIFYTLQLALLGVMWKAYRRSGQPFGLCCQVLMLTWAHFDNLFETPFGAIPLYLLTGLAAAPLALRRTHDQERPLAQEAA